jgi:hypothetical protein
MGLNMGPENEMDDNAYADATRHQDCRDTGVTCGEDTCPALTDPAVYCELCGLIHAGDCPTDGVPESVEEEKTERVAMRCPMCGTLVCGRVTAPPARPCAEPVDFEDGRIS